MSESASKKTSSVAVKKGPYIGSIALLVLLSIFTSYVTWIFYTLPSLESLESYNPILTSFVYDRNGKQIGSFYRENRVLSYEFPDLLVKSFVSAEDSQFFEHQGVNFKAMFRALLANLKAGKKVQGASTITQQVARSFLLTREKTYTRKLKEVILSYRIEQQLEKKEILFLYLNQIYFGKGAYGVTRAAQVYFGKPLEKLKLSEIAVLAGLPQAPSRYSPFYSPRKAKARQHYVLKRLMEDGHITEEQRDLSSNEALFLYLEEDKKKNLGFFLEVVRQILVKKGYNDDLLEKGLHIKTSLDLEKQNVAYQEVMEGLRNLDKRQGYRGALKNILDPEERKIFLVNSKNELYLSSLKVRKLDSKGDLEIADEFRLQEGLPSYLKVGERTLGVVTDVDDNLGLVHVDIAEAKGIIDIKSMSWARVPNSQKHYRYSQIKNPSVALKTGDVIGVKIIRSSFYKKELSEEKRKEFSSRITVHLEQEPRAQASLLSFDQRTGDVVSMVGGRNFDKSKFNRTYQALRQTGSSFKPLVYISALDKGFVPTSKLQDIPLVFDENKPEEDSEISQEGANLKILTENKESKIWKPTNYHESFSGEITLRNAIVKSLNIPTIKLAEKLSTDWIAYYSYRLGIFNDLKKDLTLALGSSSTTLYEMMKVFSHIGRLGKKTTPRIIQEVKDSKGEILAKNLSLDVLLDDRILLLDEFFEKKRKLFLEFDNIELSQETSEQEKTDLGKRKDFLRNHKEDFLDSKLFLSQNFDFFKIFKADKEPPFYFKNPNQLIKPQTAYIMTNLLQGVIQDPKGTGRGARSFSHPAAGKTGTSSDFFDAWFLGYTKHYVSGVWVGFDEEKSLGKGEGGGRAALPIWLSYMREIHQDLPKEPFTVPEGIIFLNIDSETGGLPNSQSEYIVSQAFLEASKIPVKTTKDLNSKENKSDENERPQNVNPEKEESLEDLYRNDLSE